MSIQLNKQKKDNTMKELTPQLQIDLARDIVRAVKQGIDIDREIPDRYGIELEYVWD